MKNPKLPTIKEIISVIELYNVARGHELQAMPKSGFPDGYKNELMDKLYDCALFAAIQLKSAQIVFINFDETR